MKVLGVLLAFTLMFIGAYPAGAGSVGKMQTGYAVEVGRTEPVYNVTNAAVVTGSGAKATVEQVRTAIIQAANTREWSPSDVAAGHIVGTLHVRTHMAQVDMKFTAETFSITYKNSDNLLYNGGNIHRNYNKWIKILQNEINKNLAKN